MTNVIRRGFHSDVAGLFANDIRYQRSNYYYFLGKIDTWGINDITPVSIQIDSANEDFVIRSNSVFFKKISPNDISLVIDRFDWKSGDVFAKWDHTQSMAGTKFYCMTDNNVVYKCLDNNSGVPSTVKPTGNSFQVIRTSDGYLWKYMYTIPTFKRSRFTSVRYIPVQRALTDSFYNKGSIDEIVLTSGGTGYVNAQLTTITVTGTTTGTGAAGTVVTNNLTGKILSVTMTNGGSGYTNGVNLSLASVVGSGAIIEPVIAGGIITGVTVVDGGFGYTQGSNVNFDVGGAILIPSVSRGTGSIDKVTIVNPGTGYIGTPTLSVFGTTGLGIGKYGNPGAVIQAVVFNNKIVRVTISDPGINYPSSNDTNIIVQGDGTGAEFSPIVHNGSVVDVVVENSGVGYTSIILTVVGSGTGAQLKPIVSSSDFLSDQSIVEQMISPGAIYSVTVTNQGTDYSVEAFITIVGDGTGCLATPVVQGGKITGIRVTNYGTKYSHAKVIITDPLRSLLGTAGTAINAAAYVVLPPSGGHGKDAVSELLGSTVAINSSLRQEPFLNNILQDYRQFGLIRNPTNSLTGRILDADSYLITYSVVLNTIVGLLVDEILSFQEVKFRVVSIGSGNVVVLQQLGNNIISPIGNLVADTVVGDVTRTYVSNSIVSYPIANKYSGNLLYVSNESPFIFTENQGITIKTFLTF